MSYIEKAEQYARDVLSGAIPAGKYVRLAVQRHVNNLEQAKSENYPYYFDEAAAQKPCRFIENLVHVKGEWGRTAQHIELQPWQCFVITTLFGWMKVDTETRRFREAYIEIPRKNGKSILAAGLGLYMLTADGEYGAEVYCGATSEKQAWEVFRPAKMMAGKSEGFAEHFGVKVKPTDGSANISVLETGSKFEPIVGKPGDGSSPHFAIIDEYHEHPSDEQYDTMQTGMGARSQPMMFIITTGGYDTSGPCYALHQDVQRVLDDVLDNEQLFGIIWSLDDGDDWADFAHWEKANPNLNVSIYPDYLQGQLKKAGQSKRQQNRLLCKHLNMWVNAKEAWLSAQEWDACKNPDLKEEDFAHLPCYSGLDLASVVDIAAHVRVYVEDIDDKKHYYAFGDYYLPEAQVNQIENSHYQGWHKEGFITAAGEKETDFSIIEGDILELAEKVELRELAFDKWQSKHIVQRLEKEGIHCEPFAQNKAFMSPAMKEVEAAIKSGRLHHNANPALTWMINNVVAKEDEAENVTPSKERPDAKIDGAVALIMAVGRAMLSEDHGNYIEGELFFA
jgi:phage terminase large subunit-like protein